MIDSKDEALPAQIIMTINSDNEAPPTDVTAGTVQPGQLVIEFTDSAARYHV